MLVMKALSAQVFEHMGSSSTSACRESFTSGMRWRKKKLNGISTHLWQKGLNGQTGHGPSWSMQFLRGEKKVDKLDHMPVRLEKHI